MEARLCLVSLTCGKIKCINKIMFAPMQEKWNFPCKFYFLDTCQPTDITEFRVNICFRITAPGCEVSGPLVVHPVHPPSIAMLKENRSVFVGFIKQTRNRLGSIRFGSSKKDNLQVKCNSLIRRWISEKVSLFLWSRIETLCFTTSVVVGNHSSWRMRRCLMFPRGHVSNECWAGKAGEDSF